MAYDPVLAARIRSRIGRHPAVAEMEMFGGIAFTVGGNMAVGVIGRDLMVRVGKDAHDEAVGRPGARMMDMTSRPMRGWILVSEEGTTDDGSFAAWVDEGVAFAESLPPR
jgi:TfoX/Sxy family transcriptional regulator of competence genes